ncbi:uncharacterized protein LOC123291601 [Chrysoperla carnea]|uniref:uncharacterized protein LOC123291601 n=1 Tax=Chrysoperla carnea TaxID=189513 RepID=UPI001D077CC6|nr:uncharacterized protein LOC123291601 [Chrysoperla carnea]
MDLTMEAEDLDEPNMKRQRLQTMRVLTGSIEKILHWHKILPNNVFCLFETIGPCIKVNNGFNRLEKRLLLRDERGPVLQVSYYETEIPINEELIQAGKIIHCIGRMVSANRLIALKISEIQSDKSNIQAYLSRISFKLENTVNRITYQ